MFRQVGQRAFLATTLMMVLFFHAAHMALVVFDPHLSSRPLADALMHSPEGTLVTEGHYYPLSSIVFYANRAGLLWDADRVNMEYGSYAPGALKAFIDDSDLVSYWNRSARCYFFVKDQDIANYRRILGAAPMYVVAMSGGKSLYTNQPLASAPARSGL